MKRATVQIQFDAGDDDREVIVAHAYRDNEITCTLLIEQTFDNQYRVHRLRDEGYLDIVVPTLDLAIQLADNYLAGFMSGYDGGYEHGWKEHIRHDRPNAEERKTGRCVRCGSGITPTSGIGRGRADVTRPRENQYSRRWRG